MKKMSFPENMRILNWLLVASVLGTATLHAQSNETLTKIVIRDVSPNVKSVSFAAQPKTLWRMGKKCGRVEEAPDPTRGIHGLMIVNEPDAWMINLMDKSGQHMVDPGPDFDFHADVLPPEAPKAFKGFELGTEFQFLHEHGAKKGPSIKIEGQECDSYELTIESYRVVVYAKAGTEIPFKLKAFKDNSELLATRYDAYETNLPPDKSLFEPPKDISIAEAKSSQAMLMLRSFEQSDPHLTEAQKLWALALTGILAEGNHERHDLLAGVERTDANIEKQQQSLREWWGIKTRKDLFKLLQWLDQEGHRREFDQLGPAVSRLTDEKYNEVLAKAQNNPQALQQLQTVRKYYQSMGDKGILAWDYCRFISLCRWGYLIGYINENEAWNCIMPAARRLQATFGSWKELGENYLIGREFWSYEQTKQNGPYYRKAYQTMLSDPASPWNRYSWKLSLVSEGTPAPTK